MTNLFDLGLRGCVVAGLWWLSIPACIAGEPERAKGLSVHMLPDRVAKINGGAGGFTVTTNSGTTSVYSDPKELLAFYQTLSSSIQENGIWIVTTSPSAYSNDERAKLRTLVRLCDEKKIPLFTCRGSELPNGWKRAQVPSGWE